MKKIILIPFTALLFTVVNAQVKAPSAEEILQPAFKQAVAQHKNVLVLFTASWCGWCRKMDASVNDSSCKKLFDNNYILVHLSVHESSNKKNNENAGADSILQQINASDEGVPVWIIFDPNKKILATSLISSDNNKPSNIGCPANEKEVTAFTGILKRTSFLTDQELEIITTVFRKNEL